MLEIVVGDQASTAVLRVGGSSGNGLHVETLREREHKHTEESGERRRRPPARQTSEPNVGEPQARVGYATARHGRPNAERERRQKAPDGWCIARHSRADADVSACVRSTRVYAVYLNDLLDKI